MTTNVNADAIADRLIATAEAEIAKARGEIARAKGEIAKNYHAKLTRDTLARLKGIHGTLVKVVGECKTVAERESVEVSKMQSITTASEAAAEMRRKASEIRKSTPGLDGAEALAQAMDENPELAAKYRELRNAGRLGHETTPPPSTTLEAKRRELHKSKGNPALRDFSGVLEKVRKEKPRASESEIWTEAHRRRPDLYARAHEEGIS